MAITADLRLWYEFDDNTDSHGVGPAFTEVNTPTYISGLVGNGVDTDATNQSYLSVANASAGDFQIGTGDMSFSIWAYFNTLPAAATNVIRFGAINASTAGWHCIVNNTGQVLYRISNGTTLFQMNSATGVMTTGVWTHIAGTADRDGNAQLFVNNVRVASTSISSASASDIQSSEDFLIGGLFNQYSDAVFDEFNMWDSVIPLSKIDWLYNDGAGRSYANATAATTLGGRFRENFGSLSTGTGTPAGFTALDATNATFEVVTDAGSEGGQALEIQKGGAGNTRLAFDEIGGYTQLDMVIEAEVSGSGLDIGMVMGSVGASGSQNEYLLRLSGTALTISEISAGTLTIRATAASAIGSAVTSGVVYAMRFRRQLDTLYGRAWIPATEDEPSGWDVTWADSSPFGGRSAGVEFVSSSGTLTVHYIAAAVGGDAACILDNDDLPTTGVIVAYQTDSSIRMLSDDGSTHALISIIGAGSTPNIQGLAVHQGNKTIFVCKRAGGAVVRVDQYGMNETVINNTIQTPFGIAIDEATGTLYVMDRSGRECYTDDIAGGAEASLFTTTGDPGYISFDGTYIWYSEGSEIYRRNADGTSPTSYGSLANPLAAISDGTTMVGGWFQTNTGIRSKPIASPGDSFTSVDTVTVQALAINGGGTETYGSDVGTDAVYHWSDYPPTTANRTQIASIDAPKGLGWFDFATVASASGGITQGEATAGGVVDVLVQASGSLTQGGATVAGAVDVIAAASGSLTQGAATLSGSAGVLVQVNGTLTQGGAVLAGVIGTPTLEVSGSLTQGAATVAGATDVLVQTSGSLVQGLASLAGGAGVLVQVSGSLTQGGAVLAGNIVDPNNQIADIELSAAPLFNVAFSASPLFNIALTAEPRVT